MRGDASTENQEGVAAERDGGIQKQTTIQTTVDRGERVQTFDIRLTDRNLKVNVS